jgi:putative membrane protein
MTAKKWIERGFFWSIVLLFIIGLGINIRAIIIPVAKVPWGLLVAIYAGLGYAHANYTLGHLRAHALLVITLVTGSLFEIVGLHASFIFGAYEYTDVLRWHIFGMPIVVPFAYFMMVYPCYVITNVVLDGVIVSKDRGMLWRFWLSVFGAMLMTAWDLTMDPLMSHGTTGAWRWLDGGPWFGVPLQNFAGWMVANTVLFFWYRAIEQKLPHVPLGNFREWWFPLLPVLSYAILAVADTYIGGPYDVRLVAPFVMGTPALAALMTLLRPRDRDAAATA